MLNSGHTDVDFDGLVLSGDVNCPLTEGQNECPWTRIDIKDHRYQSLCLGDVETEVVAELVKQWSIQTLEMPSKRKDFPCLD